MRLVIVRSFLTGLLAATQIQAQQRPAAPIHVLLTGVVADSVSGHPIAGATVTIASAHRVAFTDSAGRFSLDLRQLGRQRLQVRQMGYAAASVDVDVAPGAAPVRIVLEPDPVPLAEITARAGRSGRHTIEGTVVDSVTGRPIPRVVVWFRSSGGNAVTDTLGHYVFERAREGPEDVVVDVLGYFRRAAYPRITEPWQRLDFALQPDPIVLQGIVAFARGLQHVSVHERGFRHAFSEHDLARSGRHTVFDFLQSSQVYAPPHETRLTEAGTVLHRLPCAYSGGVQLSPFLRPRTNPEVPAPPEQGGIAEIGGGPTGVLVNGRPVLGGEDGRLEVQPSDFYRALYLRDFRCGGANIVILFTKARLRDAFHARRGEKVISPDSLEALVTATDTLR